MGLFWNDCGLFHQCSYNIKNHVRHVILSTDSFGRTRRCAFRYQCRKSAINKSYVVLLLDV